MDHYRLGHSLLCDSSLRLEIFSGFSKALQKDVIMKVFHRSEVEELDVLLKAAIRHVRAFQPQSGALYAVFIGEEPSEQTFQVIWVFEKQDDFLDPALLSRELPGTPADFFDCCSKQATQQDLPACCQCTGGATAQATSAQTFSRDCVFDLNSVIDAIVTEARVEHPNTVRVVDVSVSQRDKGVQLTVCTEKVQRDLASDLRRRHNQRFEEAELVKFLLQVSAGLVYAKFRVLSTQGTAHGNLRPEHIFVSLEDQYKVGNFGCFCESAHTVRKRGSEDLFQRDVHALGQMALELACSDSEVASLAYSSGLKDVLKSMLRSPGPEIEEVRARLLTLTSPVYPTLRGWRVRASRAEEMAFDPRRPTLKRTSSRGFWPRRERSESEDTPAREVEVDIPVCASEQVSEDEERSPEPQMLKSAEQACLRSLELKTKCKGEMHPSLSNALNTLCGIYLFEGRLAEATQVCHRDIEVLSKAFGDEHPSLAAAFGNLSTILKKQGKLEDAARMLLQSLHIKLKSFCDANFSLATSFLSLSRIRAAQGRLEEAEEAAFRALVLAEAEVPRTSAALDRFRKHLRKIQLRNAKS